MGLTLGSRSVPSDPVVVSSASPSAPDEIHWRSGHKLVFNKFHGGYDMERDAVCARLTPQAVYTIANVDLGRWETRVSLVEDPLHTWSSVFFTRVVDEQHQ